MTGPPATALAEVHAELILIHPFREGNGRLARLLALLMALQAGFAAAGLRALGRPWPARLHRSHPCGGGPRLRAAGGDVRACHRPLEATRRFQCAMKAASLAGLAGGPPLAKGEWMPSTALEV